MGRAPAGIDLVHPVARLRQRVVRIARAWPVTQRLRRRDASLARIDDLQRLVGQGRDIEHVDLVSWQRGERGARALDQAARLGDLAGAGVLTAGRAVHEEDASWRRRVFVPAFGCLNRRLGRQPLERQRHLRIGMARTGGLRAGRLAIDVVTVPRLLEHLLECGRDLVERRVVEAREEAVAKFCLREGHPLPLASYGWFRHGHLLSALQCLIPLRRVRWAFYRLAGSR